MLPGCHWITDLEHQAQRLAPRGHGWIEVAEGRLVGVALRPWPRRSSWLEARLLGPWLHRLRRGDRCRLYFNQSRSLPGYLALTYAWSARDTRWATVAGVLAVLDEIARIKHSDALVCEVVSPQISDRLLRRSGWQPHLEHTGRRHWIKRFYGDYPAGELPERLRRAAPP